MSSDSLHSLTSLPSTLQAAVSRLEGEKERLSVQNYGVHIENAEVVAEVSGTVRGLRKCLEDAGRELPALGIACRAFRHDAQGTLAEHGRYRDTLKQLLGLLELLEVPQLLEACSRAGRYAEALEVARWVVDAERRHTDMERARVEAGARLGAGAGARAGAKVALKGKLVAPAKARGGTSSSSSLSGSFRIIQSVARECRSLCDAMVSLGSRASIAPSFAT